MVTLLVLAAWLAAEPGAAGGTDAGFVVEVPARMSLVVGQRATFEVVVKPAPGLKVQSQAPLTLALAAEEPLRVDDDRLDSDAVTWDDRARPHFGVGLRADAPCACELTADWTFFLCSPAWCRRVTGRSTIPAVATEASSP